MTDYDLKKMQADMASLGMQTVILTKTLASEVEQYELQCLQGKPEVVLETHRLQCEVALSNLLDGKRQFAESCRAWSIATSRKRS